MSNQRPGKTHRAGGGDSMLDMQLRNFFQTASGLLADQPDAQFYFDQIVEHINNGGSILTDDPRVVSRILGV